LARSICAVFAVIANTVWPLVSMVREMPSGFPVHSCVRGGTLDNLNVVLLVFLFGLVDG